MTDANPTLVVTLDTPSETGDDTSQLTDLTTCMTDGNTGTACNSGAEKKIGKSPDDAMRIEFAEDQANLANGDTVAVFVSSAHQFDDAQLLAYTDANSVTATDKVTAARSVPNGNLRYTFTLTTAFIGQLGDLGSGKWGVRFSEKDSHLAGDIKVAEVEADLTVGGVTRRVFVID